MRVIGSVGDRVTKKGGRPMEVDRFDAWTRRHFGAVAAGAIAGLFGLSGDVPLLARKKKKKRGKTRKRHCERLGTHCNPNNDKQLCCVPLFCQSVPELGGNRCCKTLFLPCAGDAECCGNLVCTGDHGALSCRTEP
jgi:hypothetical protein